METVGKHTPGPWPVRQSNPEEYPEHYWIGPAWHADGTYMQVSGPIGRANANLIAAAPDLLAALEAFAAIHDNSPDNTPWGCGLTNGHFFRAKEAIAKAKGGAP